MRISFVQHSRQETQNIEDTVTENLWLLFLRWIWAGFTQGMNTTC